MNVKITNVAIDGLMIGKNKLMSIRGTEAPSREAASIYSRGTASNAPLKRNTPSEILNPALTRTSPRRCDTKFADWNCNKIGNNRLNVGIISPARKKVKMAPENGSDPRERANPMRNVHTPPSSTAETETVSELTIAEPRSTKFHASG